MKDWDDATNFAVETALLAYDEAAKDPVTAPAAYGIACIILKESLDLNLRAAALLLDIALQIRTQ